MCRRCASSRALTAGVRELAELRVVVGQFGGLSALSRQLVQALRIAAPRSPQPTSPMRRAQAAAANRFAANVYIGSRPGSIRVRPCTTTRSPSSNRRAGAPGRGIGAHCATERAGCHAGGCRHAPAGAARNPDAGGADDAGRRAASRSITHRIWCVPWSRPRHLVGARPARRPRPSSTGPDGHPQASVGTSPLTWCDTAKQCVSAGYPLARCGFTRESRVYPQSSPHPVIHVQPLT